MLGFRKESAEAVTKPLENESGKQGRFVVWTLKEERVVKFFFFIIPTLKHIRN